MVSSIVFPKITSNISLGSSVTFGTGTITSEIIEKYFDKFGISLRARIKNDISLDVMTIDLQPNFVFRLNVTKETMESKDSDSIENILRTSANQMKEYYVGTLLNINNHSTFGTPVIKKPCIVYNPEINDLSIISAIAVALEL
jgi:DNA integrity scanning protein DisA with diadenylate cyclase activity